MRPARNNGIVTGCGREKFAVRNSPRPHARRPAAVAVASGSFLPNPRKTWIKPALRKRLSRTMVTVRAVPAQVATALRGTTQIGR